MVMVYRWFSRTDQNLPPCPVRPLPVVGHLLSLDKDPREQYKRWRQKCGDIFSLYLGEKLMVVLNGYDVIHEALVTRGDEFSDRPRMFVHEASGSSYTDKGFAFLSGNLWRENRGTSMRLLKQLGMGRNIMAEKIQEEVSSYLTALSHPQGQPTDIRYLTYASVSNVTCSLIFGHRFDYDDAKFQRLINLMRDVMSNVQMNSLLNFVPLLKFVPGDFLMTKRTTTALHEISDFVKPFIAKYHQNKSGHSGKTSENFITAYFKDRDSKHNGEEFSAMDDKNLIKMCNELFFAGTETVAQTLTWCVVYVVNYPDVQEKIHREIKEQIGALRMPNIQDKTRLPYLAAVINETLRLSSILPFAVPRSCSTDTEISGYKIPKGSYICPNLSSVLHDEKIWGDNVMTFHPERFLEHDGRLKKIEEFVPFSLGPRNCLGVSQAKMELFLFLSAMFQRFEFRSHDPGHKPSMVSVPGFTSSPLPFKVIVTSRNI
ncbi:cytochrome P450 2D15-like [Physella acuta]|uniref:cytochrome P450 2D15-like n=1 Tax=Physella acuta TaxID=109671 RepID=UPI0027DD322E|nr:cytochrome P450 2D15-like [Physella acuta]